MTDPKSAANWTYGHTPGRHARSATCSESARTGRHENNLSAPSTGSAYCAASHAAANSGALTPWSRICEEHAAITMPLDSLGTGTCDTCRDLSHCCRAVNACSECTLCSTIFQSSGTANPDRLALAMLSPLPHYRAFHAARIAPCPKSLLTATSHLPVCHHLPSDLKAGAANTPRKRRRAFSGPPNT